MLRLTIIISVLLISAANASEWQLNLNHPSGNNSFSYSSDALKYGNDKKTHPRPPHVKPPQVKPPPGKPYPPYMRDPGFWYGYPRLGPWYGPRNSRKETVIIKEREVIREVPVVIQPPEPEKVWVPPVYEEKVVPGHYTSGIREWVDEDGYRNFADDDSKSVWIPEHTIRVIVQEGYWKEKPKTADD